MTTSVQPRQPLGAVNGSRWQALGSMKNRQNAVALHEDVFTPSKPIESKSNKRAFSCDTLDDLDSENVDLSILSSPSKKARGLDGNSLKTPNKARFSLITTPANAPTVTHKALSLSVPTTSNITPISHSRGSPKHKRVGLLAKGRRASSSPYRRIDAPNFNRQAGALPFSIDAALSGTISSYKAAAAPVPGPVVANKDPQAMPKSWFFEIHEDTAEVEAANLMEHSASVLDISSDDDCEMKRRKLEQEIGKENVPPPDFLGNLTSARRSVAAPVHKGIHSRAKAAAKAEKAKSSDFMQQDRSALAALDRQDFFPEGLDERSVELIDEQKLSSLSKETTFDFCPAALYKNEDSAAKVTAIPAA